jgi:polyisoprenoid-binding protein YceI
MRTTTFILFMMLATTVSGQIQSTRTGQASFFSKTSIENIEAVNNEVNSMLNTQTGEIVFAVLIKSFRFEKALMEEHFNENYMESDKLPKALFNGKIVNLGSVNFHKDGNYPVTVEGDLTIHGVKQHVNTTGILSITGGKVNAMSEFTISLSDYKIERPALVAGKIAENINIKINCQYAPKQ